MGARKQFQNAYGIKLSKIAHIELFGFLACVEIVVSFSALGFISLPPISFTTLSIIVIIAAMYLGPVDGILISLLFAMASMWRASNMSAAEGDIIFSPFLSGKPVESLVLSVLTRVLFALFAGLLFRWFFSKERKHRRLGIAIISSVSTAVHAALVYVCMITLFNAGEVETTSSFDRSLLISNIILYIVTILVALFSDRFIRRKNVARFFEVISEENIEVPEQQKRIAVVLNVLIVAICILIFYHFMSRIVEYFTSLNLELGEDYIKWLYSVLSQFTLGFVATFGIVLLFFRWMQKYFSYITGEMEESKKLFDGITSSYEVAYVVNMADDSYRLLKAESGLIYHADRFENYSESKKALFEVIHPYDRERMRSELEYGTIREKLKDRNSYTVEYRVVVEEATSWHEMNVTKIDNDVVALGFADRDAELTKLHLEEKRFEEYFALYMIDIDRQTIKTILNNVEYKPVPVGISAPYTATMMNLSDNLKGEAGDFFRQVSDINYVRSEFAVEDKRTYSYRSDRLGGSWVDVTGYVVLRNEDGTPAMFTMGFSIVDTLTKERQELQSKIAEQNSMLMAQKKELEDARVAAEAANRSKTDFLFNMSHDIRTPMNAITGFTNMAIKHVDDKEKVLDCLDKTQKAGNMLLSLINGVLEVSRIESGHATLELQRGDVYYSFADIENTMRELAETKDISLTFEYGQIRDRYVYADFGRCMRIFVNVISNAIKYTQNGGFVKVTCEQEGEAKDGYVSFRYTVADNGIGMSDEFQKHVFEQFARENTTTVSGIQGTGLGMAVVKSFIDLMNGTIDVESKQGEGSTFTIILPFKLQEGTDYTDPNTGEVVSKRERERGTEKLDLSGRKVLLVEDNELNREIATDMLEEEGIVLDEADDGTTAIEKVKERGPEYYDFILMDIQMPVMNGYEATRKLREMYPDVHIPIIALSANAFAEDKAASLEAGMDEHVSKPIKVKELNSVIAKILK